MTERDANSVMSFLFDPVFYESQLHETTFRGDPLTHYRTKGWKLGLSPSPYLDVSWYRLITPELADGKLDPFEHFATSGIAARKDPHPLFRSQWYWKEYLEDEQSETFPIIHYISTGCRNGSNPSPLFLNKWYVEKHLGASNSRIDPLLHYILGGWKQCSPNPLFDISYYCDVLSGKGVNPRPDPFSHYLHVGYKSGFDPHPLIDSEFYIASSGRVQANIKSPILEEFFINSKNLSSHPLFDADYYKKQLAENGMDDVLNSGVHSLVTYIKLGYKSLISPHPFFSKSFYYAKSPDVYEGERDALVHYVTSGWTEGRNPHPLFDANYYRSIARDAEGKNPLIHYLSVGFGKGLPCRTPEKPDECVKILPGAREVVSIPTDKIIFRANDSKAFKQSKVGVFAHIFYPELAEELVSVTNNIPISCTLYITTDAVDKVHEIEHVCRNIAKHPFEIRLFQNRGRDIAPMLVGFRDKITSVDYGVHIHTKKSKHYHKEFAAWRQYLLAGNLGTEALVWNILGLLSREKAGAYIPDHFPPIRKLIQWGGNFGLLSSLMSTLDEEITREHVLDFPSGSMFWFKSEALSKLLDLNLIAEHFDPESGQVDGTLAHVVERGFLYFIEAAGFEYYVGRPTQKAHASASMARSNRIFPRQADKGEIRHHYPETTKFLVRPSLVEKPRINLLIPTVDTTQGYAGVATALDLFHSIRRELGDEFDGRLIATDASMSNQYCPPDGYEVMSVLDRDLPNVDSVVDGAQRYRYPYYVRDNDYFIATAWWTAQNGFDICCQQDQLFGSKDRPLIYVIQDYECGFYPWSTKFVLADATYRRREQTIPVFNTELLFQEFKSMGYYDSGYIVHPGINLDYKRWLQPNMRKEPIVLLYARPHAERNCLPFLDALISLAVQMEPATWRNWRFLAIGEDFNARELRSSRAHVEVLGRLSLKEYAQLASRAALGVSLMVSPHPSYPPLEMAEAGVLVLTNTFSVKDLAELHDNIKSFSSFDLPVVAQKLCDLARLWDADREAGWRGRTTADWFFGGASNLAKVAAEIAHDLRQRYSGARTNNVLVNETRLAAAREKRSFTRPSKISPK